MISIREKLNTAPDIPYDLFAPRERIVFLDIETTGLRAGKSMLYLIGAAGFEEDSWYLHQFLAESGSEEMLILKELSDYLNIKKKGQDHVILVTYNGDRFDLPFLKEVERQYGKTGSLNDTVSFDLYKNVRPYKKLLGLPDLTLNTVETFCGITRKDEYSGLELIDIYKEYLRLHDIVKGGCEDTPANEKLKKKCLSCILLHNAEDIADMLPSMSMLSYKFLFEGYFAFESAEKVLCGSISVLDLKFRLNCALPKELFIERGCTVVSASGKDKKLLEITISLCEGDLRHYFEDVKNYYYLPAEDTAIHKSVGEFVDRSNRMKATADTCYVRERGLFAEVPEGFDLLGPVFKRTRKGTCYIKYTDSILQKEQELKELCVSVLKTALSV